MLSEAVADFCDDEAFADGRYHLYCCTQHVACFFGERKGDLLGLELWWHRPSRSCALSRAECKGAVKP